MFSLVFTYTPCHVERGGVGGSIYEGDCSAWRPGRFTREERTIAPTGEDAEWAPEPVWVLRRDNTCPDVNRTPVVEPTA
jgi:hypothetical protein